MSNTTQQKAVIYFRMASYKQSEKGCAVNSQENRCREFAKSKGYEVVKVFYDEGVSGNTIDRPKLKALLNFVDEQEFETVVIFDTINRLALEFKVQVYLCSKMRKAGGKPECLTLKLGSDTESLFVEAVASKVFEWTEESKSTENQHQ